MNFDVETLPEVVPFTFIDGLQKDQRGRLGPQSFSINTVQVCFQFVGPSKPIAAHAVMIPQFPEKRSVRSVAGHFERSAYQAEMKKFDKVLKENGALRYGHLEAIALDPENQKLGSDFGSPSYFFHAVTVVKEKELQFNAIRGVAKDAGLTAQALSCEGQHVSKIALPAFGTGLEGHMKGFQSARAIFAGIEDFSQSLAYNPDFPVEFVIVIKNDPIHAPIIDEFKMVMDDASYLFVPEEGEIGQKLINPDMLVDHIQVEEAMNRLYNDMRHYQNNYTSYDM